MKDTPEQKILRLETELQNAIELLRQEKEENQRLRGERDSLRARLGVAVEALEQLDTEVASSFMLFVIRGALRRIKELESEGPEG